MRQKQRREKSTKDAPQRVSVTAIAQYASDPEGFVKRRGRAFSRKASRVGSYRHKHVFSDTTGRFRFKGRPASKVFSRVVFGLVLLFVVFIVGVRFVSITT